MPMIIRQALPSDAPEVEVIVRAAYSHYVPRIGKPPGPMLDDYSRVIREHLAFVAEHGGQIVGATVLVRSEDGLLLDNVAVRPDQQGKGVGRRLIERAESVARGRGFGHITLYTHELMTENIGMYKNMGYVEMERRTEKGYPRVYMRKPLA